MLLFLTHSASALLFLTIDYSPGFCSGTVAAHRTTPTPPSLWLVSFRGWLPLQHGDSLVSSSDIFAHKLNENFKTHTKMVIFHKHWETFCFRMKANDLFHLLSQCNVCTLVASPLFKEPKAWRSGRQYCWGQDTAVFGVYEDGRLQVIQDHGAQGLTRVKESLLSPLIHCLHKYLLFIIISAIFRFNLWMWLMPYLNVKGIAVIVRVLTTWGDFLWLFSPSIINTCGGQQGTYFSPECPGVWWEWVLSTKESILSNV